MAEQSSYDMVVELLNQASLEHSGASKVILLKQVQELIIHKEPNLLDNFFDEIIGFQADKSVDVRKFVITFLEHACKVDGAILSKIIGNLNMLLYDDNVNIRKKVILSMTSLYKTAVKWIVGTKIVTEVMETTWKYMNQMRDHIVDLLDDLNDGIRTHSVKFCEGVVTALTPTTPESESKEGDQSLDIIPEGDGFLQKESLGEDGQTIFKKMLDFLGSQSVTSVNLMASMTSMTSIAKKRPQFITRTIEGFESLHVNLPPTLSKSQVSSVRKSLKLQMLALLKHPSATDMIPQIATLLTDLGATQAEVSKAMPRPSQLVANRKRKAAELEAEKQRNKKSAKAEMPALPVLPDVEEEDDDGDAGPKAKEGPKPLNPVEITTEDIGPKLTSSNVADLVLLSMVMLPDEMPAHFQSTYTPIAAAGTPGQIKHISRLLAVQLNNAGLGKGFEQQKLKEEEEEKKRKEAEVEKAALEERSPENSSIQVVGESKSLQSDPKPQLFIPMSGTSHRKSKAYDLHSVTKSLSVPVSANLSAMCLQRLFKAEGDANKANLNSAFCKIIASLTTQFGGYYVSMLHDFIMADMRNRSELAMTWVYSEYVALHGFNHPEGYVRPSHNGYNYCLSILLKSLLQMRDMPGSSAMFTRLMLESPQLTPAAIDILKQYCADEKPIHMYLGMHSLQELILKRPLFRDEGLNIMLHFTYHDNTEVRGTAIQMMANLYDRPKIASAVDMFCNEMVNHLLAPYPLRAMFPATPQAKFHGIAMWTEPFIKQALYLYLALLPDNPTYIETLADVYVTSVADIKRVVLRLMEVPIKQLGMDSEQLLKFIKTSPKGSETLITRIIHILTERQAPSTELVTIVKQLYKDRVTDIRFLIPVLGGLEKAEVLEALPKLINLAPAIVKEVFNRLLGVGGQSGQDAALTPSELMIALHNITPQQCEIKAVIKATTMCFQEKGLFTQEILAIVINQLIEVIPLPTLFMRTVIQALTMHPKLLGFVINILQRLIVKQVWKDKKAWEGFVRCCQRARPQSLQVLLQLPPKQLSLSFDIAPDLRQSLLKMVSGYNAQQRSMLQKGILAAIELHEPVEVQKIDDLPGSDAAGKESTATSIKVEPTESTTQPPATGAEQVAKPTIAEPAPTSASLVSSSSTTTTVSEPLPPGVEPIKIEPSPQPKDSTSEVTCASTESNESLATPAESIATTAESVATTAESVATPAESIATPAESIATTAEPVATPVESMATTAESLAPATESVAPAAESVATPVESVATPAESMATAAESMATTVESIATLAATTTIPEEFPATNKQSDSLVTVTQNTATSADMLPAATESLVTDTETSNTLSLPDTPGLDTTNTAESDLPESKVEPEGAAGSSEVAPTPDVNVSDIPEQGTDTPVQVAESTTSTVVEEGATPEGSPTKSPAKRGRKRAAAAPPPVTTRKSARRKK